MVTASLAGTRGDVGMPSYVASKHGVVGLVKAAAVFATRSRQQPVREALVSGA